MALVSDETTERLIEEVRKRPALYSKHLKEYGNANVKKKLWEEVCSALVENWDEKSNEEKISSGRELQAHWLNLETTFAKEMKARNGTKSGQAPTKRRKYIYFDKLLFLARNVDQMQTTTKVKVEDESDKDEQVAGPSSPILIHGVEHNNMAVGANHDVQQSHQQAPKEEDMDFALSLVPMLKGLPKGQKIDARIEILQVFRRLEHMNRCNTTPFTYCNLYQASPYWHMQSALSMIPISSPFFLHPVHGTSSHLHQLQNSLQYRQYSHHHQQNSQYHQHSQYHQQNSHNQQQNSHHQQQNSHHQQQNSRQQLNSQHHQQNSHHQPQSTSTKPHEPQSNVSFSCMIPDHTECIVIDTLPLPPQP